MKGSVNGPGVSLSKVEQIKAGTTKKTELAGSENKKVIQGKGAKYTITEKEKKFEEAGVKRKKKNFVMYESKLGTEKEQDLEQILMQIPKEKPKPIEPRPRQEEKIVQQKKRIEYLDNYQYKETKVIKDLNPAKQCIVEHRRLGDIIGGSYEETTYQKQTMTDSGRGGKLYSQQSVKTSTKRDVGGRPVQSTTTTTQRTNTTTTSRTLPAQSREMRKEMKKITTGTTNSNLKSIPKRPAPSEQSKTSTTTKTVTKTTTTRTRTATVPAGGERTTTQTTRTTRTQSAGRTTKQ